MSPMEVVALLVGPQLVGAMLGLALSLRLTTTAWPASVRIQDRPHPRERFVSHLPLIFGNLAVLLGSAGAGAYFFYDSLSHSLPSPLSLLAQLALVFVLDDLYFYFFHRVLHEHKGLYRRIHKIHHEAYSPLPLEYIYAHPLEWMGGAVGVLGGFAAVWFVWGELSVWTVAIVGSLRQLHELDIHSGAKATLARWVPFLAVADDHDLHHAKPTQGNYASTLRIWDRVFGTVAGG